MMNEQFKKEVRKLVKQLENNEITKSEYTSEFLKLSKKYNLKMKTKED